MMYYYGNYGSGYPMMGWWGGLGLGVVAMVLWWVLLIVLIALLIRWIVRGRIPMRPYGGEHDRALMIVRERYAKGDITKHEYEELAKELTKHIER